MEKLKLTPAQGGWVHADWGRGNAWLRFNRQGDDITAPARLTTIAQIRIPSPTQAVLRHIPLKRIEAAATVRGTGDNWISGLLLARYDQEPPPGLLDGPPSRALTREIGKRQPGIVGRRHKLKRPAGRRLDRDFYSEVAHAYQSAVAHGENPRKALASDTGNADATVAAWVQEARRLGFLPTAEPGKVSA